MGDHFETDQRRAETDEAGGVSHPPGPRRQGSARTGDRTGDEATDGAIRLGPGTLYRTLKHLVAMAWIEEVSAPDGEEDPRRRHYGITDSGRAYVRADAERLARIVRTAKDNAVLPETS